MSKKTDEKLIARRKRHRRVRKKVSGSPERPRLSVFRSLSQIYAQVIDDLSGNTLFSASSIGFEKGGDILAAKKVGTLLAQRAKELNICRVVFDRGGYIYHGRIKALAEAAREGGLSF